jgi:hypothetical protein
MEAATFRLVAQCLNQLRHHSWFEFWQQYHVKWQTIGSLPVYVYVYAGVMNVEHSVASYNSPDLIILRIFYDH